MEYILADGFHRYLAHMEVRPNDMLLAEQRLGTLEDAQWAAITANKAHGCRRSPGDKRNAVRMAILHPRARKMKANEIAKEVGVSQPLAKSVRVEMERNGEIPWYVPPADRVQQALADPTNAGKSYREIARLCEVSEGTVRNAASAHFSNGLKNAQVPTDTPTEGEAFRPGPHCGNCDNYVENRRCMFEEEVRPPWSEVCEDFVDIRPPQPKPEPIPDPEEIVLVDEQPKKKRRLNPAQYRRLKGCMQLHLPRDNPQLFAVELRNAFDREYLTACFAVLKQLWIEPNEDPLINRMSL